MLSHTSGDGREDDGGVDVVDVVGAIIHVNDANNDVRDTREVCPRDPGEVGLREYNNVYVRTKNDTVL